MTSTVNIENNEFVPRKDISKMITNEIQDDEENSEKQAFIENILTETGSDEAVRDLDDKGNEDVYKENKSDVNLSRCTRMLHTVCVCWTMAARGWRFALLGPTFPDLRLLIGEDLTTASWIFTAWEFGGLLGSAVSGFLYDRLDKLGLYVCLTLGFSLTTALTPWCTQFVWMVIIHALGGGCIYALGAVCTTDIIHVWYGKSSSYMQATYFFFSVGAILSPFIASPFLADRHTIDLPVSLQLMEMNATTSIEGFLNEESYQRNEHPDLERLPVPANESDDYFHKSESDVNNINHFNNNYHRVNQSVYPRVYNDVLYGDTDIYIPYTMSAVMSLIASLSFILLILFKRNVYKLVSDNNKHTDAKAILDTKHAQEFSVHAKRVFVGLQAIFLLAFLTSEKTFCGYLMTYLLEIGWDKVHSASANSLYWGCVAAGRFSGIFLVKCISLTCLIFIFLGIFLVGFIGVALSTIIAKDLVIWVSVGLSGFGMSITLQSSFSWLSENVLKVSGKQTSFIFLVANIGTILFPLLTGYIMSTFSFYWFAYIALVLCIFVLFMFTVMVFSLKCLSKNL